MHCCVTSPPYWGLRDYGLGEWEGGDSECPHVKEQRGIHLERSFYEPYTGDCGRCGAKKISAGIGLEPTFDEHIQNIVDVFKELRRVLMDDGTVWLNYGDAYVTSFGQTMRPGGTRVGGRKRRSAPKIGNLQAKQLIGMPWRIAFALQSAGADMVAMKTIEKVESKIWDAYYDESEGKYNAPPDRVLNALSELQSEYKDAKGDSWWLRSGITWRKPNPMPEGAKDRPTTASEMIFLLAKSPSYFYDGDAIRDYSGNGWHGNKFNARAPERHAGENRIVPKSEQRAGANARNVWSFPTQPRPEPHFATFPDELPRRCILAGTSEKGVCSECGAQWVRETEGKASTMNTGHSGIATATTDEIANYGKEEMGVRKTVGWRASCECNASIVPATVLDPFVGSGTTVAVAQSLGRRGVGTDLNPEYLDYAIDRIAGVQSVLSGV